MEYGIATEEFLKACQGLRTLAELGIKGLINYLVKTIRLYFAFWII